MAEMGRMKKMPKLPCDIKSDCRSELSIIGSRTMASKKGAPSKPVFRIKKPMIPNISMINISTTSLFNV
jgi:hypothetical protein